MNGKKFDVIVEETYYSDPETGVKTRWDCFTVWADSGLSALIESVNGVTAVYETNKSQYSVYVDKRFDREHVKREIEAAILCNAK